MKVKNGGTRLSSREAARLLGVSEASVKRWADGGLLPAEKTAGGHRRFRPEDIAAFRRARLGAESPRRAASAGGMAGAEGEAAQTDGASGEVTSEVVFDSLVAGRAEEASALLVGQYLRGRTVAALADTLVCPAMRRVGDLWHEGGLTVAQEHVATRAALQALGALRAAAWPGESNGLAALCCGVESDYHELPVLVAALLLEAGGWEVVTLGASTPFYALAEAVGRFGPRLVCVTSTVLNDLERASREYVGFREAAARAGASVVLGGAGFDGETLRRRFPAELHAENFGQLEAFAAALAGRAKEAAEG